MQDVQQLGVCANSVAVIEAASAIMHPLVRCVRLLVRCIALDGAYKTCRWLTEACTAAVQQTHCMISVSTEPTAHDVAL